MVRNRSKSVILNDCTNISLNKSNLGPDSSLSTNVSIENETLLSTNTDISLSRVVGTSLLEKAERCCGSRISELRALFPITPLTQKKLKKKKKQSNLNVSEESGTSPSLLHVQNPSSTSCMTQDCQVEEQPSSLQMLFPISSLEFPIPSQEFPTSSQEFSIPSQEFPISSQESGVTISQELPTSSQESGTIIARRRKRNHKSQNALIDCNSEALSSFDESRDQAEKDSSARRNRNIKKPTKDKSEKSLDPHKVSVHLDFDSTDFHEVSSVNGNEIDLKSKSEINQKPSPSNCSKEYKSNKKYQKVSVNFDLNCSCDASQKHHSNDNTKDNEVKNIELLNLSDHKNEEELIINPEVNDDGSQNSILQVNHDTRRNSSVDSNYFQEGNLSNTNNDETHNFQSKNKPQVSVNLMFDSAFNGTDKDYDNSSTNTLKTSENELVNIIVGKSSNETKISCVSYEDARDKNNGEQNIFDKTKDLGKNSCERDLSKLNALPESHANNSGSNIEIELCISNEKMNSTSDMNETYIVETKEHEFYNATDILVEEIVDNNLEKSAKEMSSEINESKKMMNFTLKVVDNASSSSGVYSSEFSNLPENNAVSAKINGIVGNEDLLENNKNPSTDSNYETNKVSAPEISSLGDQRDVEHIDNFCEDISSSLTTKNSNLNILETSSVENNEETKSSIKGFPNNNSPIENCYEVQTNVETVSNINEGVSLTHSAIQEPLEGSLETENIEKVNHSGLQKQGMSNSIINDEKQDEPNVLSSSIQNNPPESSCISFTETSISSIPRSAVSPTLQCVAVPHISLTENNISGVSVDSEKLKDIYLGEPVIEFNGVTEVSACEEGLENDKNIVQLDLPEILHDNIPLACHIDESGQENVPSNVSKLKSLDGSCKEGPKKMSASPETSSKNEKSSLVKTTVIQKPSCSQPTDMSLDNDNDMELSESIGICPGGNISIQKSRSVVKNEVSNNVNSSSEGAIASTDVLDKLNSKEKSTTNTVNSFQSSSKLLPKSSSSSHENGTQDKSYSPETQKSQSSKRFYRLRKSVAFSPQYSEKENMKKGKRKSVTFATTARMRSDSNSGEISLNSSPTSKSKIFPGGNNISSAVSHSAVSEFDLSMTEALSFIPRDVPENYVGTKNCHSTPVKKAQVNNNNESGKLGKNKNNHVFLCPEVPSKKPRDSKIENSRDDRKRSRNEDESGDDSNHALKHKKTDDKTINELSYDTLLDVSEIPLDKTIHQKKLIYHSTPINPVLEKKRSETNFTGKGQDSGRHHKDQMIQVSKTLFGTTSEGTSGISGKKSTSRFSNSYSFVGKEIHSKRKTINSSSVSKKSRLEEKSSEFRSTRSKSTISRGSSKSTSFSVEESSDGNNDESSTIRVLRSGNMMSTLTQSTDESFCSPKANKVQFRGSLSYINSNYMSTRSNTTSNESSSVSNLTRNKDQFDVTPDTPMQASVTQVSDSFQDSGSRISHNDQSIPSTSYKTFVSNDQNYMSVASSSVGHQTHKESASRVSEYSLNTPQILLLKNRNEQMQHSSCKKKAIKRCLAENERFLVDGKAYVPPVARFKDKWVSPQLVKFCIDSLKESYDLEAPVFAERVISHLCSTVSAVEKLCNYKDVDAQTLVLRNILKKYNICSTMLQYYSLIMKFTPFSFQRKVLSLGGYYGSFKVGSICSIKVNDPIVNDSEVIQIS